MAVYKNKWNGYSGDTWCVACYYKDLQENRKKHDGPMSRKSTN